MREAERERDGINGKNGQMEKWKEYILCTELQMVSDVWCAAQQNPFAHPNEYMNFVLKINPMIRTIREFPVSLGIPATPPHTHERRPRWIDSRVRKENRMRKTKYWTLTIRVVWLTVLHISLSATKSTRMPYCCRNRETIFPSGSAQDGQNDILLLASSLSLARALSVSFGTTLPRPLLYFGKNSASVFWLISALTTIVHG